MDSTTWSTITVWIRIRVPAVDVPALEELLGLSATKFVQKGTRRAAILPAASRDTWVYEVTKCESKDLDDALTEAERILLPRIPAFQAVRSQLGYQPELYLSFHSSLAQGGFQLSSSFLKLLGDAGLPLLVSILSWGGVVSEKEQELPESSKQETSPEQGT